MKFLYSNIYKIKSWHRLVAAWLTIMLFAFSSCEKKTDWTFDKKGSDLIVVDGIITNERKTHEIRITKNTSSPNEVPEAVSGATVTISDGLGTMNLLESPAKSGKYVTGPNFMALLRRDYKLTILYNGKIYTAQASMEPVQPIIQLLVQKDVNNDLFHINWVARAYNPRLDNMYEILIDWSFLPTVNPIEKELAKKRVLFYTLKTLDVSELFAPQEEKIMFPQGTRIVERKYSLTEEHAVFIRSLLSETSWRGGYFDVAPANTTTNLSNGGIGFFGVCMVLTDTIYVR